jgi:hypothetical protein
MMGGEPDDNADNDRPRSGGHDSGHGQSNHHQPGSPSYNEADLRHQGTAYAPGMPERSAPRGAATRTAVPPPLRVSTDGTQVDRPGAECASLKWPHLEA